MTTKQKNLITLDFMIQNLDNFFDAYFDTFCKVKSVEKLILNDQKLWINFFNDPNFMLIDLDYLQGLFNQELKEWRKDFTQYFA
jgi:hypothetical protein